MFIRRILSTFLVVASVAGSAFAATNPQIAVRPQARITQKIDITKLAPLTNTHPAWVAKLADGGRVSSNTMLHGMTMLLKASDNQEYALQSLLDAQQDKSSANYHQWATPDSFGEAFGVDSSDIAKVTDWLQTSGFSIDSVTKSKRLIRFSGTAASVEAAFHTEMHQYQVNGETRIANSTDIAIPRALAPVFAALPLNNLRPTSNFINKGTVTRGADGQLHPVGLGLLKATADTTKPNVTEGGGAAHYVGGADLPILFDSAPLLAAGNDGTGIKIAILGQTDILLGDIQTYRTMFGLKPNNPNFITIGQDPSTQPGDDGESDLDVEASGAMAPGAQIDFYAAASDIYDLSGVLASGLYVIENNSDDIISLSYGDAEVDLGSDNGLLNFLWEQAASQGISVFVSSGDSGPDTYDDGQATAKTTAQQYSVSGFSSTPYNVAVGGTMFDETSGAAYWATTNTLPGNVSALGYIPEQPWNETALGAFYNADGGFGGIVAESSGISTYYGTPSWQAGPGVPTVDPTPIKGTVSGFVVPGPHRYQPDVALQAAAYDDGFLTCSEGSCVVAADGTLEQAGIVGGTSIAAPSMAGVQALIDQKNGGRQGLPNYYYYRLAAVQSATTCNSSAMPIAAVPGCAFHDIQKGNNYIPSKNGGTVANGNYVGWSAGPGFDLAIGLGSPDINNLATTWKSVSFNATTTAFSITPASVAFGAPQAYNIAVTPVSGTGTPTGDVSIIAETTAPNAAIGYITLASGTASGTLPDGNTLEALPAGTYKVHAHYAGDTTYGGSNSPSVQVTVGQGSSTITVTPYYLNPGTGGLTQTTNFTYGQNVYLDATVCDPSGAANSLCSSGTPTGTLTFALSQGSTKLPALTVSLNAADDAYFLSGFGLSVYEISPNYPVLPAGTYTVNVAYSGDSTFTASNATPFTITIGGATAALTATAVSADITSGATATINASVATIATSNPAVTSNGATVPTGTVTFTDTTTSTALGSATLANGALAFTTTGLITTGAHSITAAYSGDANYTAISKTLTITVGTSAAGATPTVAFTGGLTATTSLVGQTVTVTATVASPATGAVYFYDGTTLLGNANLSTSTHTAKVAVATFTAGTHNIKAVYAGSTSLSSSNSVVYPLVVGQNTPSLLLQTAAQSATGSGVAMNVTLSPTPDGAYNANTGVYGPLSPAPSATMSFLDNGTSVGTAPVTFFTSEGVYLSTYTTKALTPGVHTLTAQYTGDTNYAAETSNAETFNVGLTTTVISAPATVGTNAAFPITAQVTPIVANSTALTGTVTFMDGTTVLGTATVSATGAATVQATVTTLGAHTITASYSGDTNYYKSSTTASISPTAVAPTFTLSINPASITLGQGYFAQATVTGTAPGYYYGGAATLSCSGLPANSSCDFLPPSLQFSGSTATSTFYIKTMAPQAGRSSVNLGGLLWIPAIFMAGFLALRRKQLSTRGRHIIALAVTVCAMMATVGCSGNNSSAAKNATPLGTSTVTITATGPSQIGSPTATTTLTLTVN